MTTNAKFTVPLAGEYWPFTFVVVGDLLISLTREGPIPDEVFDQFCATGASTEVNWHFGCAIGGANITSVQRKKIVDAFQGITNITVIESSIARGLVTAVSWLGMNIKSFSWKEFDRAITMLDTKLVSHAEIRTLTEQLLKRSGAPSLDSMIKTGRAP